jgi:hypothetical protein
MKRDTERNPQTYLRNTPGVCTGLCLLTLDPHGKAFHILLFRWNVVWLCIHWVVQDTKQHPEFPIYAIGFRTSICVLVLLKHIVT